MDGWILRQAQDDGEDGTQDDERDAQDDGEDVRDDGEPPLLDRVIRQKVVK